MLILNKYPPEAYGNLKTLCEDLKVSYHTYKVKQYPFKINGVEVFKTEIKRGGRKKKNQIPTKAQIDALVYNDKCKKMNIDKAIKILELHNKWRRDNNSPSKYNMQNPTEIGKAIDKLISEVEKLRLSDVNASFLPKCTKVEPDYKT